MTLWLAGASIDHASFPHLDRYPYNLPLWRHGLEISFTSSVTFFLGENGSGKTTLLEALARRCGIHIWGVPKVHRLHENPDALRLCEYLDISWWDSSVPGAFFSAETFRDWAEFLDDVGLADPGQLRYFGGASLTARSHGQGTLAYFEARYRIPGIYFLDEPEAALSPASQLRLVRLLHEAASCGQAQFLIATHSPILLALPGADILVFGPEAVREVSYEETENYRLYREFLAAPDRFIARELDLAESSFAV